MQSSSSPAPSAPDAEQPSLEAVQRQMAALAHSPMSTIEVPVARISGRVLAEPIEAGCAGPNDARRTLLDRGTVLSAVHVATLAGLGLSTARVFERTRVGIIVLRGDGDSAAQSLHASVALATLSAAVEQMGAKAFGSSCKSDDEEYLVRSVKMFAAECALVLIVGFPGEEVVTALKRAGLSCDSSGIRTLAVHPFGKLQLAKVGSAHMVALPAEPDQAFVAFASLVSPLLRALSGRSERLPMLLAATLAGEARGTASAGRLMWVRDSAPWPGDAVEIVECPVAPLCFAGATGLAWHAPQRSPAEPAKLAYMPFKTWLA